MCGTMRGEVARSVRRKLERAGSLGRLGVPLGFYVSLSSCIDSWRGGQI